MPAWAWAWATFSSYMLYTRWLPAQQFAMLDACAINHNLSDLLAMTIQTLIPSALIGAVASARSMTPMAALSLARLLRRRTPGPVALLDRPLFRMGALAMGAGELYGDKMKTAPDRTVFLGLLARVLSAAIAGAALAPRGRAPAGAVVAVATAVPLAYATLKVRKKAISHIGQTPSGLVEDALVVAAGLAIVALVTRAEDRNG